MHSGTGFEALRRGRASQAGSCYFVTLSTASRRSGLSAVTIAVLLRQKIDALAVNHSWLLHGAVIMPDHLHILITLGDRLTLGQTIGRLKAKTRGPLAAAQFQWQGNYFDHRLRSDDSLEGVLRYMFLNPYRARLLPVTERYSWFWLGAEETKWFHATPADELPALEWLQ